MKTVIAAPEPEDKINFVFFDDQFVCLGNIDEFLNKLNEKFSGNGLRK